MEKSWTLGHKIKLISFFDIKQKCGVCWQREFGSFLDYALRPTNHNVFHCYPDVYKDVRLNTSSVAGVHGWLSGWDIGLGRHGYRSAWHG